MESPSSSFASLEGIEVLEEAPCSSLHWNNTSMLCVKPDIYVNIDGGMSNAKRAGQVNGLADLVTSVSLMKDVRTR